MPRRVAFGRLAGADVVGPAGGEHEERFIALGFREFTELCFPASLVPGILFENGAYICNCSWIFPLQNLIRNRAAQHVAGDVPGESVEGPQNENPEENNNGFQSSH